MKPSVFIALTTLIATLLLAEVPEHINFHAMVYDTNGEPLVNDTINMKIELLDSSGIVLYTETNESVSTDAKGITALKIGTQTTTDDFSALDFDEVHTIKLYKNTARPPAVIWSLIATQELSSVPFSFTCKELSGDHTSATGDDAQAWGYGTTASSFAATAWGGDVHNIDSSNLYYRGGSAQGDGATAWGKETNASNDHSTAWGSATVASGQQSTTWGRETVASNILSTAWGQNTKSNGYASTVWGAPTPLT